MLNRLFLSAAFLLLGAVRPAYALLDYTMGWGDAYEIDPTRDWRTVETDHFIVSFPAEVESGARRLAGYLEKAHSVLSVDLRWVPRTKVQALVMDNVDSANGLSTPLFRFGMILYLTPPEAQSAISYSDNWLWMLAVHEYTHFLNMDVTRGYAQGLRTLFGDGVLPNTTLPSWFLEGLAVYEETRWSQAGRGRAPYFRGALRLMTPESMTLDRVNGSTPYYPFGDTAYQFGYHLVNYLSRDVRPGPTRDGDDRITEGMDALGLFSWRGGGRIPFFIDDNLQNLVGQTWPSLWRNWRVEEGKRREAEELQLRSQPLSPVEMLTDDSLDESTMAFGAARSPDGHWLAYTAGSAHRIGGLYLRELDGEHAGRVHRLFDKSGGARLSFSPDSRYLFLSKLDQRSNYYSVSDLWVYDVDRRCLRRLTDGLRAKDPAVSPDGKRIAFTQNEGAASWIAVADLQREVQASGDRWSLGPIHAYKGGQFDAASHPSFWDDSRLLYALHPDGANRVDIHMLRWTDPARDASDTVLYSDGHFNRTPFALDDRTVGFVSDRTGVDNVFRLTAGASKAEMVTHVMGGLGLPSRWDSESVVSTVVTGTGINLAHVKLAKQAYDSTQLTLPPPPLMALPGERPKLADAEAQVTPARDYRAGDSFAPRLWGPIASFSSVEVRLGAVLGGLDALDRHAYFLFGQYAPVAGAMEGIVSYTYRGWGPRLNLTYSDQLPLVYSSGVHLRERTVSASATFPYRFTYSSLSTTLGAEYTQDSYHYGPFVLAFYPSVPSGQLRLTYARSQSSSLAVHAERGGTTSLGVKTYLESSGTTTKLLFTEQENFHLGSHWVLSPSIQGQWTSRSSSISATQARVAGRSGASLNPLDTASFSFLPLRGYPATLFVAKSALVGSLELNFPLLRIFRGEGTLPFFLEQFYGIAFAESAFFPGLEPGAFALPSAGGGIRLDWSALLRIPLTFVMEGHYGYAAPQGGGWDWVFGVNVNALAI